MEEVLLDNLKTLIRSNTSSKERQRVRAIRPSWWSKLRGNLLKGYHVKTVSLLSCKLFATRAWNNLSTEPSTGPLRYSRQEYCLPWYLWIPSDDDFHSISHLLRLLLIAFFGQKLLQHVPIANYNSMGLELRLGLLVLSACRLAGKWVPAGSSCQETL